MMPYALAISCWGERLHADQKAAALAVTSRPLFNLFVELPPAAQVEVPNAEVRPMGDRQCCSKRRQQLVIDIVEYLWHPNEAPRLYFCGRMLVDQRAVRWFKPYWM
jgi:hypothetical protein